MKGLVHSGQEAVIPSEQAETDVLVSPAVAHLWEYQEQLDADGVMVGVSRQALDEMLQQYLGLLEALIAFRAAMCADIPCGPEYNSWLTAARAARDQADAAIAKATTASSVGTTEGREP